MRKKAEVKIETRGRKSFGDKAMSTAERSKRYVDSIKEKGGIRGTFVISTLDGAAAFNARKEELGFNAKQTSEYLILAALKAGL